MTSREAEGQRFVQMSMSVSCLLPATAIFESGLKPHLIPADALEAAPRSPASISLLDLKGDGCRRLDFFVFIFSYFLAYYLFISARDWIKVLHIGEKHY